MTEEQRMKYAQVLEKLDAEQREEFNFRLEILDQAMPEKRVTIKGQTYYSLVWKNPDQANRDKMRIIVGVNGWMFFPASCSVMESIGTYRNLFQSKNKKTY